MPSSKSLPATARRVEHSSSAQQNDTIHRRTQAAVAELEHAEPGALDRRVDQLDREWDVERSLQANASILALTGTVFGATVDRRFLLLPTLVFGFLAQHALQGWCPPLPVLRRLGFRTQKEIQRERHAVKTLRGDYDKVPGSGEAPASARVQAALDAARR